MSTKYNTQIVEAICRLPEQDVSRLFRWHARQPIEIQIEAHKLASDLYYQFKEKYPGGKNEVRYSVFVLALKKMEHLDRVLINKNTDHDLEKIRKIAEMKADRFLARKKAKQKKQRSAGKKDKLIAHWDEIQMLRGKGFSFRLIAEFLRTHRYFAISWTYIAKIWKELEK